MLTLLSALSPLKEMTNIGDSNPQGIQCMVDGVPTLKCFEVIFGNVIFMSAAFILLILFIMFMIGGFHYLTSLGNPEKVKKAQGTLQYAIIGLVLYLSAFLILKIIDVLFLGGHNDIFHFEIPTQ